MYFINNLADQKLAAGLETLGQERGEFSQTFLYIFFILFTLSGQISEMTAWFVKKKWTTKTERM